MKSLKKIFSVFSVLFLGASLFAYGGKAEETQTSIVGHIKYFGNAPFEFPGFETVDGFVYTIRIAENSTVTLKEIEAEQGYLLELTGEVAKDVKKMPDVLKDGVFLVSDWKKL